MSEIPRGNESVTPDEIRKRVEMLFHTPMQISLLEWQPIAQDLLGAATRLETLIEQNSKIKPRSRFWRFFCALWGCDGGWYEHCKRCGETIPPHY
jgi:hypothetical protein